MLVRCDAWRLGALVALIGAAVMVMVVLTSPAGQLFHSDALYFRIVAEHPFGHSRELAAHATETGDAYRYGRMLYPFVAWLLAFGHAPWVRWTLPFVNLVALGCAVAFASELLARRGVATQRAVVLLVVPGVWLSVSIAFSEVFVIALVLLLYLLVVDGRSVAVWVVSALGLLARETAAIAVAPIAFAALRRRRWTDAAGLAASLAPLLAWWVWVHHRIGQWPPLDDSLSRREALSYPFGGMIEVIRRGADASHWVTFALGVLTFAIAVVVFARLPWFPITPAALLFGVLVLCLGPNAYQYPGEAIRLMTPAQVLTAIAIAARSARR